MADRVRGIQVHRPIIYGSHARLLTPEEKAKAPEFHTHKWTVFLTSAASPPPQEGELDNVDYLPGGADDLSYMIKRVTFKLHETYTPSSRQFDKPPYLVTETGWGEFTINIRVQFVAEASEKPLNLSHSLKLHHWGAPIDAPPPPLPLADSPATQPTAASSAITPAPATAAASSPVPEEKAGSADARPEAQTDVSQEKQEIEVAVGKGEAEAEAEVKTETAVSTPAPGDSITAVRAGDDAANNESMITHHLNSVAARLPVHAWQYDELVFSDPPSAFLEIMNEHPPTPLPAKFRRPRDQREKEEGSKKKKGRLSVSAVVSRAQTQEPGDSGTPAPVTPIGIHGEPGSADVPLEFAKEMEVGETNRLMDVKVSIIDQMDKLRTRLIAQEKELGKLKAEMKVA